MITSTHISYLPATCYALIVQRNPLTWENILQPYILKIKCFTAIYKTRNKAVLRLVKLSKPNEIELIQAANYYILKKQHLNFEVELENVESDLNQYHKQLSYLTTEDCLMPQKDKIFISKYYSGCINALNSRKTDLILALEIEAVDIITPNASFPKNNC